MKDGLPANLTAARLATMRAELQKIRSEVEAYEELRGKAAVGDAADPIEAEELGLLPILGRISRNLSQRELAELLGLKEQQIQRYERQRYSTISLERYQRVLSALGVEVHPQLSPRPTEKVREFTLDVDLKPELLRDLRKRGWVDLPRTMARGDMLARLGAYVEEGNALAQTGPLNRRTRKKTTTMEGVLQLWMARVLRVASEARGHMRGRFNITETAWLGDLVRLSVYPDGPLRAVEMLRERGIVLVVEPHLPSTALDGAAFLLAGGIPVVALTIRHDRLDNFWFTLLHELGHIYLHFNRGLEGGFVDDDLEESRISELEQEADDFARNWLIPDELWRSSVVRFSNSQELVERFARAQNIHPSIVAGRIRKERDYKLFASLTGSGKVKSLFVGNSREDR